MSYKYYCVEVSLHLKYGYKTVEGFILNLPKHGYNVDNLTWLSAADKKKALAENKLYSTFVPAMLPTTVNEVTSEAKYFMASSLSKLLVLMGEE